MEKKEHFMGTGWCIQYLIGKRGKLQSEEFRVVKSHARQRLLFSFEEKRKLGQIGRVFTNGPGDRGSIPGRVIPKTQKIVLDAVLFNTHH